MKGHFYSLAAYMAGKEFFTCSKHWTCLNLNLSRMKKQFLVTHLTQFYRIQKKLTVLIVLKCGNLNLLETSGPLQACNGIALPFTEKNFADNQVTNTWPCYIFTKILKAFFL
jgi:hypothetical protein